MSDASSEGHRQGFQELSFRRERPAFNPFYGRFVALIKIVLPTIATALIVLVAVWPHLDEQKKRFQIETAQIDPRDAENLRMLKPLFNGVDDSRRPFSITANTADQTDAKSTLVELHAPEADVLLGDSTWVALTARKGVFDREKQILELSEEVNLSHAQIYPQTSLKKMHTDGKNI